jgi:hypothetical protein
MESGITRPKNMESLQPKLGVVVRHPQAFDATAVLLSRQVQRTIDVESRGRDGRSGLARHHRELRPTVGVQSEHCCLTIEVEWGSEVDLVGALLDDDNAPIVSGKQ